MKTRRPLHLAVCTIQLRFPGCASLKEKRGLLKPLLTALHREFGLAAAEIDGQDLWGSSIVACATLSNDAAQNQRVLQSAVKWVEENRPDVEIESWSLEER